VNLPPSFKPRELLVAAQPFLGPPPDLGDLRYLMVDRGPEITESFYAIVLSSPEASKFILGPEELQRLLASLERWLQAFFASAPSRKERAEFAVKMTAAHLEIGMPLELFILGHKSLRRILVRELMERWPAGDRLGLIDANERLNQAFDYDLLLMVTCYHGSALASSQSSARQLEITNAQLQQSLAAEESLLRTTSHELRTPLAGLVGLLNLVRRGAYETKEQEQSALDDVLGAANHLLALTDDLLNLARLDLGRGRFDFQNFNGKEAAEEVVRRFEPRAEELGLSLKVSAMGGVGMRADRDRFEQVLSNLLQNALRHTSEGEIEVRLEALEPTGLVQTSVRDSGEGIPPELMPHLFKPLTQEQDAQSRRAGSLGLGLTICRRLVLAMGGRIWVDSNGPGTGATFAFTLPEAGASLELPKHLGNEDAERHFLVVDDDASWATDFSSWLAEECDARVTAVSSVAHALEQAQFHSFALIMVDAGLPSPNEGRLVDGIDLLKELVHLPDAMFTPKWLVSGHQREVLEQELAGEWHDAFWNKGDILADRQKFLDQVRELLAPSEASE
jgi:signal transduction histidine kinase